MSRAARLVVSGTAAAAMAAAAAHGHHSPSMYDMEQTVTIEGVVTRVDWANPHVYIYLEQDAGDGAPVEWEVEAFPPSMLIRQGWSSDTLAPGDPLTVVGNPARNPDQKSLFPSALEQDGAVLFSMRDTFLRLASASVAPETSATGLQGTWETLASQQSFALSTTFFLNPAGLGVTHAGREALAAFDEASMHPGLDCTPFTAPLSMYTADIKAITVDDDAIRIRMFDGGARTIRLDADEHDGAIPSLQGHSIGRWEGDTLVVDTTLFADHRSGNGLGLPSGSEKHLEERFTLSDDGTRLTYRFELSDPEFLLGPLADESIWAFNPDFGFDPPACDLGSARRFTLE